MYIYIYIFFRQITLSVRPSDMTSLMNLEFTQNFDLLDLTKDFTGWWCKMPRSMGTAALRSQPGEATSKRGEPNIIWLTTLGIYCRNDLIYFCLQKLIQFFLLFSLRYARIDWWFINSTYCLVKSNLKNCAHQQTCVLRSSPERRIVSVNGDLLAQDDVIGVNKLE